MDIKSKKEALEKEVKELLTQKERTGRIINQIDIRLIEIKGSLKIIEEMENETKEITPNESK